MWMCLNSLVNQKVGLNSCVRKFLVILIFFSGYSWFVIFVVLVCWIIFKLLWMIGLKCMAIEEVMMIWFWWGEWFVWGFDLW